MENELKQINKDDRFFHMKLLKYYYNFINFYKQDENLDTDFLKFDFGDGNPEDVYGIRYAELKDKAYAESIELVNKYTDDGNYKI